MNLYKYEVEFIEGERDSDLDKPYRYGARRYHVGVDEDFMTEEDVLELIRKKHSTMWYSRTKIISKERIGFDGLPIK